MPGFCVNCGAPLTGAFCVKCGTRGQGSGAVSQPSPAVSPPPPAPSAPTSTGGAGVGKALFVVGAVLVGVFVLGIAGAFYGLHLVKHRLSGYASTVSGGGSGMVNVSKGNSCRLLSVADLQQILGVQVERSSEIVDGDTPGCAYYTNQTAFNQLQRMAAEFAKKQTEAANNRPGPKPDNLPGLLKNANDMEGVVKTLGLSQPSPDGQVFSFTVQRNAGPDAWAGARLVQAAVPGFEEVKGVGDRAMIGAFGHAFYVQKGGTILYLNTMLVPDARTRGIELGNKILSGL
jgi:hypothetical protein